MTKRIRPVRSYGIFGAVALSGAAFLSFSALGEEEAHAAPDPQAVATYLAQLEAEDAQAARQDGSKKPGGRGEQIRKVVEGAAVRAPSGSLINGIEAAIAEKLG